MIGYSTVTQKGQITIPASIRRLLGLKTGKRVQIVGDHGHAKVKVAPDFFSMTGSVKSKKTFNIKRMRESAKQHLGKRYGKTP